MGTSSSNPGPRRGGDLLPDWVDQPDQPLPPRPPQPYRQFRTELGRFVKSGNRDNLNSALSHYVRSSMGGTAGAVARMAPVSSIGGQLFDLFTDLQQGGTGERITGIDLTALSGQDCRSVIDAIVNALTKPGSNLDNEVIRRGLQEALSFCLGENKTFDPAALNNDMISDLILDFLSEEIFMQIYQVGSPAFDKAENPEEEMKAENEMREVIKAIVDVKAGPIIDEQLDDFKAESFKGLIDECIRKVYEAFENNE